MTGKLSVKELYELKYEELSVRIAEDYSEITTSELETLKNDERVSNKKVSLIDLKFLTSRYLKGDKTPNPDGNEYYDEESDMLVEYIPLDRLRFKIEEIGKRDYGQDFTLGKISWGEVIPRIGLGERVGKTFVAFDDIDECYRASHPRTGGSGFNVLCIDKFYRENIAKILVIKEIVEESRVISNKTAEIERQRLARYNREMVKQERELQDKLNGLSSFSKQREGI